MRQITFCEIIEQEVNRAYYCPEQKSCETCSKKKEVRAKRHKKKKIPPPKIIDLSKLINPDRAKTNATLLSLPTEFRKIIERRVNNRFNGFMTYFKRLVSNYDNPEQKKHLDNFLEAFQKTTRPTGLKKENFDAAIRGLPGFIEDARRAIEASKLVKKYRTGDTGALERLCNEYPDNAKGIDRIFLYELMRFQNECIDFKTKNKKEYFDVLKKALKGNQDSILELIEWDKFYFSRPWFSTYIQQHQHDTKFLKRLASATRKRPGFLPKISDEERVRDEHISNHICGCFFTDSSPLLENPRKYLKSIHSWLVATSEVRPKKGAGDMDKHIIKRLKDISIDIFRKRPYYGKSDDFVDKYLKRHNIL